jgi:hypothetical protein
MAVDYRSFLARFPEFEPAGRGMIRAAIEEATRGIDTEVWGDKTDDGVRWLTAHLLAISPFGQQARMVSKEGSSTYGDEHKRLMRSVTPGFRVA